MEAARRRALHLTLLLLAACMAAAGSLAPSRGPAAAQSNGLAIMTSPAPGSTLAGSTVTFSWSTGTSVQAYWLYVGTTVGGTNLYTQNEGTSLSATVNNLPTDGSTLYVRLWSEISSAWQYNDYTYTAWSPSPPGIVQQATPANRAVVQGTAPTFTWSAPTGAISGTTRYTVKLRNAAGTALADLAAVTNTSAQAPPAEGLQEGQSYSWNVIACNGSGCSAPNSAWYLFSIATGGGGSGGGTWASMVSPPGGTALPGAMVTFSWSTASGAQAYWLMVGTTGIGTSNLYSQNEGTNLSAAVNNLPTDGSTLYVRLWTELNGSWGSNDYTYTASGTSFGPVQQSAPANGAIGQSTTPTLSWSAPSGAIIGTTQYTVALKDATGNALPNLPATTSLSVAVPASEQLQADVGYAWNVTACNGPRCTAPNPSWYSFTTAPAAPPAGGTLGATSIGSLLDSNQANYLDGSRIVTGASAATVQSISVAVGSVSAASNNQFQAGIYTDQNGVPGTLVASSASGTLTANSWSTVPVSATLAANTAYWLLYNTNAATGADNSLHYENGSSGQGVFSGTVPFGTWPQSFGATTGTWVYSIYATLAGGSAPPAAPGVVTLAAPADGASNVGQTPALSWTAPSGAVSGTTSYTVSIWDPSVPPQGQKLADLTPTTTLSVTVPASEGLLAGHAYFWNVSACNGQACSAFAARWFQFDTSASPNTAAQSSPANGAGSQSPTLTLAWTAPSNAVAGQTTYTVSLWDPYGGPAGHLLGDLPATTATSVAVPVSEALYYGQQYYWNINACNGTACSGYNSQWFAFTTAPQPAATLSGAITPEVTNPDFSGAVGTGLPGAPGWTAGNGSTITIVADPSGFNYLQNGGNLSSNTLALDFPSHDVNGTAVAWFRIGTRTPVANTNNAYVAWTSSGRNTIAFSFPQSVTPWSEYSFPVYQNWGASGQLWIVGGGPDVAYVERVDGPRARGGTAPGLLSGAAGSSATDLALPGMMGLGFTRVYNSEAPSVGAPLTSSQGITNGPLGAKWTHTWQYRLSTILSGGTAVAVVIQRPGGAWEEFVSSGSSWAPQAGVHDTLLQGSGSWTLTTPDQHRYSFTGSSVARLSAVTDRNGNTTTLSYDSSGTLLQRVSDPGGRFISLTYNGAGQITSAGDSAGRTVGYAYNGSGDLVSVSDVLGHSTSYGYNGHLLTSITDPLGNTVQRNSYDGLERLSQQTDAAGGTLNYAYATPGAGATRVTDQRGKPRTTYFDTGLRITDVLDAYGNEVFATRDAANNLMGVTGPVGDQVAYTYDQSGNVLTSTDAEDFVWHYAYDALNDPLSVTDPQGNIPSATYDARGNLATVTDALGNTKSLTVNSLGQVTAVKDPRGNTTTFGYNASGDRTSVTDALGQTTTTVVDAVGRPTSITDALNHTSSSSYNAAGWVLSSTDALNDTASATYDADGHKLTVTDPDSHKSSYAYDARGLLTAVTDAANGVTGYSYDAAGNRLTVTDANNHTTTYTYDSNNRPLTVKDPLGNVLSTLTYDAAGRVLTSTDAKGQKTTASYTPRSELAGLAYADGTTVGYQYDAMGNRTQLSDQTGLTTYRYDPLSRLTSVTVPGPHAVSYSYDAAGNRTAVTYPNSTRQAVYAYDQLNRLLSVTDWNSAATSYAYDAAGRLTTTTLPSSTGVTSSYSYDNANRLQSVTHQQGGTTLAAASYTLDAAGNRTAKTTPAGTENYILDTLNRLTSATPPGGTATTYSYDAVGNRLNMVHANGTTSYAYDAADRLASVTPPGSAAVSNGFDANGSQTARGADTFSWDAVNRLASATVSGQTSSFGYNGDNLRQSRTALGSTTSFVWDIAGGLPVVLDDGSQYVYGAGLVSHITASGTFYYLTDGLGSTMALVDSTGSVVQSYDYDVYGAVRASSGSQPSEYQFAGQQTDPSGLQYLRARYYDPSTGRFLSRDPVLRNHPYSYGGDNPALSTDPSGLDYGPSALDILDAVAVFQQNLQFDAITVSGVTGPGIPDLPAAPEYWYRRADSNLNTGTQVGNALTPRRTDNGMLSGWLDPNDPSSDNPLRAGDKVIVIDVLKLPKYALDDRPETDTHVNIEVAKVTPEQMQNAIAGKSVLGENRQPQGIQPIVLGPPDQLDLLDKLTKAGYGTNAPGYSNCPPVSASLGSGSRCPPGPIRIGPDVPLPGWPLF